MDPTLASSTATSPRSSTLTPPSLPPFQPIDRILASLIQFESAVGEPFEFYLPALIAMFFVGFVCLCFISGSGAPAGLFIPSLIVGAAGGRIIGRAVSAVLDAVGEHGGR
eukprot:365927-Chlamydomonas_euryale.AAC.3